MTIELTVFELDSDQNPVVLEDELHPYRGFLREGLPLAFVLERAADADDEAGLLDQGDVDSLARVGVDQLRHLWRFLELVVPGDQMRPWRPFHRSKTNLVFTADACGADGASGGRWAGRLNADNFHLFVSSLEHDQSSAAVRYVCCELSQPRPRGGREGELATLRSKAQELARDAEPGDPRYYVCCAPSKHADDTQ